MFGRVMARVRQTVGKDFPVGVRFLAEEAIKDGYALPDSQRIAGFSLNDKDGNTATTLAQGLYRLILKTRTLAALCIPPSRSIVTTSSPFTTSSPNACDFCQRVGHAQYKCPKRFFETFGRQLPGFLPTGEYDFPAWLNGDLLPATRHAMATYLGEFGIPPHRKFNVTLDISIPVFSRRYDSFLTPIELAPFHSSDPTPSSRSDLRYVRTL